MLDYSATKGAIVSFTRPLSQKLLEDEMRVNGVAPGPIWTPLIPASFDAEKVSRFGSDAPHETGSSACYVFLASEESSYTTGQVLHPNGGEIINGRKGARRPREIRDDPRRLLVTGSDDVLLSQHLEHAEADSTNRWFQWSLIDQVVRSLSKTGVAFRADAEE